jgi:hypothetical protein
VLEYCLSETSCILGYDQYQPSTTAFDCGLNLFPLGAAIAYSFLSLNVSRFDNYPDDPSMTFLDLEEKGIVKLKNDIATMPHFVKLGNDKIAIPYFFIRCFLMTSETTEYSKFWKDLLRHEHLWLQNWELFNWNYIAFRLSLYSYLGYREIPLKNFFAGAKSNVDANVKIIVPSISDIRVHKIPYRYPSTQSPDFPFGISVWNGSGAPFDSFMYVKTTSGSSLLLAFQMKLANQDSKRPQVINDDTLKIEFDKVNDCISTHLCGTEFVLIILGQCEGAFIDCNLPHNCVVVSKTEQMSFYGQCYYYRLKCL